MKRMIWMPLAVCLVLTADLQGDDKKDLEPFAGTWTVASLEHGGNKVPADMIAAFNLKLIIKGDTYESLVNGEVKDKGTLKVDASKNPKTVDITATEGENKGKTIRGIYEFTGDEMKCCYDLDGTERPKEFKTAAGTMQLFVVYKKAK